MKKRTLHILSLVLCISILIFVSAAPVMGDDSTLLDLLNDQIGDVSEDLGIEDLEIPEDSAVGDFLEQFHDPTDPDMTPEDYQELWDQMLASVDELIENYSGSLELSLITEIPEDEVEALLLLIEQVTEHQQNGTENEDDPSLFEDGEDVRVGSYDEFMDIMFQAQEEMVDLLTFETVNGYSALGLLQRDDFRDILYDETTNRDPIVGAGSGYVTIRYNVTGSDYVLAFEYDDKEAMNQMRSDSRSRASEIASSLAASGQDDYTKVSLVNSFLCQEVTYPYSEPYPLPTHMAYGAVVDSWAVCEGYAGATAAILRNMGVDCMVETGPTNGGGYHAWNLVKVDGSWYQLDVTWNDTTGNMYFLVTDDYMRESRSWDEDFFPSTPGVPYMMQ